MVRCKRAYPFIFLIFSIFVWFLNEGSSLGGERVFFYHTDALGTPVAITDDSGDVVWRADYMPFGEEDEVTGSIDNKRRFIGKEKDEETGLYYFGARYMDAGIGRFITPDPAGPVDPWTSRTNETLLLNPQRLNRYSYGLNNPYRYVDPDGGWAEDVHSGINNYNKGYGTYYWARQVGFSEMEARIIARGNISTDRGPWTNWLPLFGDQSRHFDKPYLFTRDIEDTREYWADVEFQRALKYWEKGDYEAALGHLGEGLHSLQDKYAHRDWDTEIFGLKIHPPWYDVWADPRNKEAAEATRKATIEYLKKFYELTKK